MRKALTLIITAGLLAGCGILYKQPIYQGSLLDERNVEQLQPGLSKRQVALLLGSPAIADPFHQDRWDYVATRRSGRVAGTEIKNLTLYFEGDNLARWEGEFFPREEQALSQEMLKFGNLPRERDKDRRRR